MGGTEVYVAALAESLPAHGIASVVAAPGPAERRYRHGGVDVHRFAVTSRPGLAGAQGEPDRVAAANFARVLDAVHPDIVHLHAHTSAVSALLLDRARRTGAKTVVTYHTPTFSCLRGTLLHMGRTVCDGEIGTRRCAACALAAHGVPPAVARVVALTPPSLGRAVARGGGGRWRTALAMSAAAEAMAIRFGRLTDAADRVVAPALWVTGVLGRNGVPEDRTMLVRQGMPGVAIKGEAAGGRRAEDGPLRIGFYGRSSPTKGIDILTGALALIPDADVLLDVTVVNEPGSGREAEALRRAAAADRRIRLNDTLPPEGVVAAMRSLDLVAVPSRWLETGPLVVLEAFAAGTPVLGSRLGGIAELVADGVDGMLLPADDVPAWASAIAALAGDRDRVRALRAGVRPPRTMTDVAREMAAIYRSLAA
ncbi:MAG: glycosyltransferase [Bauldia sp.]|nr:glycosyltransferase [Bauldia sp.]